jgi:hypothetical protein
MSRGAPRGVVVDGFAFQIWQANTLGSASFRDDWIRSFHSAVSLANRGFRREDGDEGLLLAAG